MTDKEIISKKTKPLMLYKKVKWHGVKDVYRCSICGQCEDTKTRIETHVLVHNKKEGTK